MGVLLDEVLCARRIAALPTKGREAEYRRIRLLSSLQACASGMSADAARRWGALQLERVRAGVHVVDIVNGRVNVELPAHRRR